MPIGRFKLLGIEFYHENSPFITQIKNLKSLLSYPFFSCNKLAFMGYFYAIFYSHSMNQNKTDKIRSNSLKNVVRRTRPIPQAYSQINHFGFPPNPPYFPEGMI